MKQYNFIDLSGYGASGKTALINIFQEIDGFYAPHHSFEFSLLRIKDGLLDLNYSLCESWSPSRGDTAIKKFKKLTKSIAYNPSKYNIFGRLSCIGMKYDKYFNNTFTTKTEKYINNLIELTYKGVSPYPFNNMNRFNYQIKKSLGRIVGFKIFKEDFYLTINSETKFVEETRNYLNDLFSIFDDGGIDHVCLYNACEPFNPEPSLNLLGSAKQIIVDRDPRDIYLAVQKKDPFVGNDHRSFSAVEEIDDFIYRYKVLRERTAYSSTTSSNILRIMFEDLVLDYENTLNKIYSFLNIDESRHKLKRKYFDPNVSRSGVFLWKNTQKKKEINYIYEKLKEYCYLN